MASQNSLRLISGDDVPSPSSDDEWVAHVVFLCAEDDDLELVSLVHRAGEERIGVEVLPGVDRDAELVLDGLEGIERDACVLFCSKDYPPSDALGFRQRFQARYPDDELIVMEVDQSRVESHVGLLIRRLVLSRSTEVSGVESIPDAPRESIPTAAPTASGLPEADDPPPSRSRLPLLLGGLCLMALIGFAGWKITSGQDASPGQSATAAVGAQAAPAGQAGQAGQTSAVPSDGSRSDDVSPNLLVLQATLGVDNPALQDLPDEQVDAAALVVTAAQSDSPCATLRSGKAGLEHTNAALLALLLKADVETPDCGEGQAAGEDPNTVAAADEAADGSEPGDRSEKRGRRSRRSRRSQGSKSRAAKPQPEALNPEPTAAEPKAAASEPKQPSTPRPRAQLIDDGLIQTTD